MIRLVDFLIGFSLFLLVLWSIPKPSAVEDDESNPFDVLLFENDSVSLCKKCNKKLENKLADLLETKFEPQQLCSVLKAHLSCAIGFRECLNNAQHHEEFIKQFCSSSCQIQLRECKGKDWLYFCETWSCVEESLLQCHALISPTYYSFQHTMSRCNNWKTGMSPTDIQTLLSSLMKDMQDYNEVILPSISIYNSLLPYLGKQRLDQMKSSMELIFKKTDVILNKLGPKNINLILNHLLSAFPKGYWKGIIVNYYDSLAYEGIIKRPFTKAQLKLVPYNVFIRHLKLCINLIEHKQLEKKIRVGIMILKTDLMATLKRNMVNYCALMNYIQ